MYILITLPTFLNSMILDVYYISRPVGRWRWHALTPWIPGFPVVIYRWAVLLGCLAYIKNIQLNPTEEFLNYFLHNFLISLKLKFYVNVQISLKLPTFKYICARKYHFLWNKIQCEHLYELVITIACNVISRVYTVRVHCPSNILFIHFAPQNFRLYAHIFVLWPCLLPK